MTLGGVETTHLGGSVYDGTGQYLVTSGGSTVEYIIGPAGQWARQGDAPWAVLAGPAPVVDPLTPLTHPSAVTVVSSDGDDAVLEATFAAAVLGFSGNEDVVVTLTIVDGVLAEIRYTIPAGRRRSGGRHDHQHGLCDRPDHRADALNRGLRSR